MKTFRKILITSTLLGGLLAASGASAFWGGNMFPWSGGNNWGGGPWSNGWGGSPYGGYRGYPGYGGYGGGPGYGGYGGDPGYGGYEGNPGYGYPQPGAGRSRVE
jgi:hypothetical protein